MSTTRKIEGKAEPHGRTWTVYDNKNWTGEDCTLVFGKAFTEDEVKAILIEIRNDYILDEDKEWLNVCAAKHGIKLTH